MDHLSVEERSENMRHIHGKNTKPEIFVRRLIFKMGFRYRLHLDLPGRPDLVFTRKKKIIFVHGCFWHKHEGCNFSRLPKSRIDYWTRKLDGNAIRDGNNLMLLQNKGWHCLVLWECELTNEDRLAERIHTFLEN
jgi:DNA mismatch endonuclease (patch repair protein)